MYLNTPNNCERLIPNILRVHTSDQKMFARSAHKFIAIITNIQAKSIKIDSFKTELK